MSAEDTTASVPESTGAARCVFSGTDRDQMVSVGRTLCLNLHDTDKLIRTRGITYMRAEEGKQCSREDDERWVGGGTTCSRSRSGAGPPELMNLPGARRFAVEHDAIVAGRAVDLYEL
jgi:hypothetical protein